MENDKALTEFIDKPLDVITYPDTELGIINWFVDNGWLRAVHSENIVRNQRHYAMLFIHPSGIWANAHGTETILVLQNAKRMAERRLQKVKQLTGELEPML